MSERIAVPAFDRKLDLSTLDTEALMRLQADCSDEIERRYRQAKRQQNARADELRRQSANDRGEPR